MIGVPTCGGSVSAEHLYEKVGLIPEKESATAKTLIAASYV